MSAALPHLLICSCEKTMPLDADAIGRGCAGKITQANQLCGLELDRFKAALAGTAPITVACTQEAPLFREVAENVPDAQLTFVNIRETGGWSKDAAAAGPKAAALIAAAGEDMPPISLVTLESEGVALIYGRDEIAVEAAQRLADRLDITVLLSKPGDVVPRRTNEFPVLKGTVRNVVDFGAFVDIGLKNDGLVHRSELGPRFVRDPLAMVSVGDTVTVRVLAVDKERGRIALSMRDV